ncbi:ran-binding protein 3b isoform X11 [Chanodichthys erythropterus]|uniref:ran-binding protein 3b isoform X11 n=1 Tax=Chanodichthys erythropterus TaxID=933992 RepID=UPI00351DB3F3
MADLANEEKPAIAPPVFVFQKDKAQKRSADGSSAEDGDDSDRDDGEYCPPVKRERTSSLTQFPPSHSVPKNNIFMPSSLCQSPTGNSDSEPDSSCGTNGVGKFGDSSSESRSVFLNNTESSDKSPLDENSSSSDSKDSTQDSQSGSTNYFLQYMGSASSNNATNSSDKGSKFVFGQNMSERVLSPPKGGEASAEASKDCSAPVSEPSSQEATPEKNHSVTESLEESAAAYTKATAKKCILEKVEVRTGEEAESNVLQMQCKLFVFDKPAQSWVERGRGLLRLNDMASTDDGTLQSRLVMRTQGSLRLILNTKLWPQMQVDKASEKSVRITAMDTEDQGVKVFLISASSKDAGQLAAALHHRILALRSRVEPETESTPAPAEPEIPQSNEDDSDDDEPANNSSGSNTTGTGNSTSSGNCESSETPAAEST